MIQYREITNNDRNRECPVLLETISLNEMYYSCHQCQYNFKKEAIESFSYSFFQCPMCRFVETEKNVIYINASKSYVYGLGHVLMCNFFFILMFIPCMILYFYLSLKNYNEIP